MPIKLNIQRDSFLTALASLQNVSGRKGTMVILSNVLLRTHDNNVEIMGTDLEVGIKHIVEADIVSPGSITLPAKKLFEIVRESSGDSIHLEEGENNWMKIEAGLSVYNMAGLASDEYPDFPEYDENILISFPSDGVKDLIEKTIFSVAQEKESNYTLTGILLEKGEKEDKTNFLRMVSSDGHRLSIMEKEIDKDIKDFGLEKNVIIPRKGIIEIKKFCEGYEYISIGFQKNQAVVKADNAIMIIRLMAGDFPNYKSILKVISEENFVGIDRLNFLESLKRINLFTEDSFNAVQLDINNEKLMLTSQNMDFGNAKDELKINYDGEKICIGFNCRYFIDTLQVMKSEFVKLFIKSDQSPCMIKGDDDPGFMSIIMPMKI